jgi:hypothetical protein
MNELNSSEHWTVIKEAMLAKCEEMPKKASKDWIMEEI